MADRQWSRDEFVVVLNLYFKIPFGSFNKTNPEVIKMAELIGRTPSSVAFRLGNYASLDPVLQARGITGLTGGKDKCQPFWEEYYNDRNKLSKDAIISTRKLLIEKASTNFDIIVWDQLMEDIKNDSFQKMMLGNYKGHCVVTGSTLNEILVGCHIIPPHEDEIHSLDPANGLLLNINFAKAFLDGLIGISPDYKVYLSDALKRHNMDHCFESMFNQYENKSLILDGVIIKPNKEYLTWHMDTIFNQQVYR